MNTLAARGATSARALLRRQFGLAHQLLDAAMDRLPAEAAHRHPPGTAVPAGACYAQIVLCEDLSVNEVLAAGAPLALSTWVGRTGLSELPTFARQTDWRAWARRVMRHHGVRVDSPPDLPVSYRCCLLDLARGRLEGREIWITAPATTASVPTTTVA